MGRRVGDFYDAFLDLGQWTDVSTAFRDGAGLHLNGDTIRSIEADMYLTGNYFCYDFGSLVYADAPATEVWVIAANGARIGWTFGQSAPDTITYFLKVQQSGGPLTTVYTSSWFMSSESWMRVSDDGTHWCFDGTFNDPTIEPSKKYPRFPMEDCYIELKGGTGTIIKFISNESSSTGSAQSNSPIWRIHRANHDGTGEETLGWHTWRGTWASSYGTSQSSVETCPQMVNVYSGGSDTACLVGTSNQDNVGQSGKLYRASTTGTYMGLDLVTQLAPAGPVASTSGWDSMRGMIALSSTTYLALACRALESSSPGWAIWKTTDTGATWTKRVVTGPLSGERGWNHDIFAQDPTNPNIVWCQGQGTPTSIPAVWKSTDSGDTWTRYQAPASFGQGGQYQICARAGSGVLLTYSGAVGLTFDGTNWTKWGAPMDGTGHPVLGILSARGMCGCKTNASKIYLIPSGWNWFLYSSDGGATWNERVMYETVPDDEFAAEGPSSVAKMISPSPGVVYMYDNYTSGFAYAGIWRTLNEGVSWERVAPVGLRPPITDVPDAKYTFQVGPRRSGWFDMSPTKLFWAEWYAPEYAPIMPQVAIPSRLATIVG